MKHKCKCACHCQPGPCRCHPPVTAVVLLIDGEEKRVRPGEQIHYGWSEELNSPRGQRSHLTVRHDGLMDVVRFE